MLIIFTLATQFVIFCYIFFNMKSKRINHKDIKNFISVYSARFVNFSFSQKQSPSVNRMYVSKTDLCRITSVKLCSYVPIWLNGRVRHHSVDYYLESTWRSCAAACFSLSTLDCWHADRKGLMSRDRVSATSWLLLLMAVPMATISRKCASGSVNICVRSMAASRQRCAPSSRDIRP